MATITPKLTVTGSAEHCGAALSLSVDDELEVVTPMVGVSKVSVLHTGSGTEIITAAASNPHTYFYAKNTDEVNYIVCRTAAGVEWGRLAPKEVMFMAVAATVGIEFLAVSATCILEYAYWTKS